ncbi:MAG TPA: flagellar assembly protein FliX [Asticcacaulis sp.]|nr:flagellar assembly protein FliX [Asticcacaulis sp.]
MNIKIGSASPLGMGPATGGVKRSGGDFSLGSSSGAQKSAGPAEASAAFGALGVDALLAIQSEDDVMTGRRRRQIKRSHNILDALDDLKVSILSGSIDDEALLRLQGLIAEHREDIEDERLQGVLNEIETRAFVELAKRKLM